MTVIGTAFVEVRPDSRKFGADAERDVLGSIKSIAKKASFVLGGALIGASAFGLKAAGDFQQVRIAFEGILGSGEKAGAFLEKLRGFAAKTPFEFPELANSAKNLLAVGFNANDVIPIMTKLGNVAATLGVGGPAIEGVVRALGQMKGKGKASAEELNQIGEAVPGFSAVQAIADSMGITVAEAFKRMEKGAIPADKAISAILAGMEKFPGAAGAMDRQSKTLNGVLSTFKDTIRDALINGIEPFLPAISSAILKVTPLLQKAITGIVNGIRTVVEVMGFVIDVFRGGFENPFAEIGPSVQGFERVLLQVGAAVRQVYEFVRDNLKPILIGLGVAFVAITSPVTLVIGGLVLLYTRVSAVREAVAAFSDRARAAFDVVAAAVQKNRPQIDAVLNAFKLLGSFIADQVIPVLIRVGGVVLEFYGRYLAGLITAGGQVVNAFGTMRDAVEGIVEALQGALRGVVDGILALFGAIIGGAANAFSWVPGLGPKLEQAKREFDQFRDDVNRSLGGIKDKTITVNLRANEDFRAGERGFANGPAPSRRGAFQHGGWVPGGVSEPVPIMAHGQEFVLSAAMLAGRQSIPAGVLPTGPLVGELHILEGATFGANMDASRVAALARAEVEKGLSAVLDRHEAGVRR